MCVFADRFAMLVALAVLPAAGSIAHESAYAHEAEPTGPMHVQSIDQSSDGGLALAEAQIALRSARLRLYQYRHVDYPRHRRTLDDTIRLTEAQAVLLDHRIASYRPFRTVGRYSPMVTSEQNYRFDLLATEQQLRQLKGQRTDHWRQHPARCRLLELEVLQAAARVAALQPEQIQ